MSATFAAGLLANAVAGREHRQRRSAAPRTRHRDLVEQRSTDIGDFSSLITAEVVSEEKTSSAAGTLFGNNMPRLVTKNGCRLESFLDGTLMIFTHRDMPGVIGSVGTIFGRHQVNIAQMAVGRQRPSRAAKRSACSRWTPPAGRGPGRSPRPAANARAWTVKLPPAGELPSWLGG